MYIITKIITSYGLYINIEDSERFFLAVDNSDAENKVHVAVKIDKIIKHFTAKEFMQKLGFSSAAGNSTEGK